ncbi:MAG: hydroxyacid dehydrogenase [Herpetosiphonaceae bacterium]|nr:MAG: hydroxyacid dehydrogenase [Herpetosiphonaceae bacterium]
MRVIVPERAVEYLRSNIPAITSLANLLVIDRNGDGDEVADADALFLWGLSAEGLDRVLTAAPKLRWIHTVSAGVDRVIRPEMLQRGITLTNSSGIHSVPIAEWVMAVMLAEAKHLRELNAAQRERRWIKADLRLNELAGKTILILGLGDIGRAVAQRAAAFAMRVWGTRRRREPVPGVERVFGPDEWRSALPEADYLVVTLPLTGRTRRLIGAAEFAALKPGAWIINIARGEIIDEPALIDALQHGHLGGAALDVFEQEPLPAESPLWGFDHVFVSPHISWSSPRIQERAATLFLENLRRYCRGEALLNVVDLEAGY